MTNSEIDSAGTSWSRARYGLPLLVLVILHAVVIFALGLHVLSTAYPFSGGREVSSIDELHRLGGGPRNAFGAMAISFLGSTLSALVALGARHRVLALTGPIVGIAVSICLCLLFITTYYQPAPLSGG